MGRDIRDALRPALVLLGLFTLLLGLLYPLAITGLGQLLLPHQANGSLVRENGRVVGSELVGQAFASARYFNSRPSAAGDGYDAAASSASNLAPTSRALIDRTRESVAQARAAGVAGPVPADLVTTSGSGLDPHLSPAAALAQVPRVAVARGLPVERLRSLVAEHSRRPLVPGMGEPRVHLLDLNRALDRVSPAR